MICGGDTSKYCTVAVGLFEIVDAETVVFVHLVGKIEIAGLFVSLPAGCRADFTEHERHLFVGKQLLTDWEDLAMAADFWRLALRQMQVRASGLEEHVKEMIDVGHDYFIPVLVS